MSFGPYASRPIGDLAKDQVIVERFWAKTSPEPTTGCLLWTAGLKTGGYGAFGVKVGRGSRTMYAHRFAYVVVHGDPVGHVVIDHKCGNPACVEPRHLRAISQRQNVLEGSGLTATLLRRSTIS